MLERRDFDAAWQKSQRWMLTCCPGRRPGVRSRSAARPGSGLDSAGSRPVSDRPQEAWPGASESRPGPPDAAESRPDPGWGGALRRGGRGGRDAAQGDTAGARRRLRPRRRRARRRRRRGASWRGSTRSRRTGPTPPRTRGARSTIDPADQHAWRVLATAAFRHARRSRRRSTRGTRSASRAPI